MDWFNQMLAIWPVSFARWSRNKIELVEGDDTLTSSGFRQKRTK
jgi:hypothetical protein